MAGPLPSFQWTIDIDHLDPYAAFLSLEMAVEFGKGLGEYRSRTEEKVVEWKKASIVLREKIEALAPAVQGLVAQWDTDPDLKRLSDWIDLSEKEDVWTLKMRDSSCEHRNMVGEIDAFLSELKDKEFIPL